jgi:hypothetical protein
MRSPRRNWLAAGVASKLWEISDMVAVLEAWQAAKE